MTKEQEKTSKEPSRSFDAALKMVREILASKRADLQLKQAIRIAGR